MITADKDKKIKKINVKPGDAVEVDQKLIDDFINRLTLFGIGYSWGGYESLIIQSNLKNIRSTKKWKGRIILRIHAGLEDSNDLIHDLKNAFKIIGIQAHEKM